MGRFRRHRHHHNRHESHRYKPKYSFFQRISYFSRKHPIAIGVLLIIASIVLFRLSFTNAFLSSSEIFMWAIIISIGLFIGGLLVLIGWWRNHISMFTTRHRVKWN